MIFARRRRSSLSNTHGRNPWIRLSIVNRTQNLQGKRSMALWRMQQREYNSLGERKQRCHINAFHGARSPANLIERLCLFWTRTAWPCRKKVLGRGYQCPRLLSVSPEIFDYVSLKLLVKPDGWNLWTFVNLIQKYCPTSLNIQYRCIRNMYRFFLYSYRNLKFALAGAAQWLSVILRIKGQLVWLPV